MFGRNTKIARQLVMTEEQFLQRFDSNPDDPDVLWEEVIWEEVIWEDWFAHLIEQRKDVVHSKI